MAHYTCIRYVWHEEDTSNCTEPLTCNITETCPDNHCMTMYQRKQGTLHWQVSGCRVDVSCTQDDGDKCILRHKLGQVYGCCCSSPRCNGNIVVNDTHMAPKTTIPASSKTVCLF